jgi:hypothetical protein
MPVKPSLEPRAFEPEATAAMGEAFDAACRELHVTDQSKALRALIATLIIAAASQGELNPVRLRAAAVAGFAIEKSLGPDVIAASQVFKLRRTP